MFKLLIKRMNANLWELHDQEEQKECNDAYRAFWVDISNPPVSHILAVESWRVNLVLYALNVSEAYGATVPENLPENQPQAKPLNFSVKPHMLKNWQELEKKALEQASGPHGPTGPADTVDGTPKTYWK